MQDEEEEAHAPDKKYRRHYCPHCNRVSEQEQIEKDKWRCCWCHGIIGDNDDGLLRNL